MSVYFLVAKVTKPRYILTGALLATLVGTAASVVLAAGMGEDLLRSSAGSRNLDKLR